MTNAMSYNKEDLVLAVMEVGKVSKAEAEKQVNNVFDGLQKIVEKMNPEDKLQLVGKLTVEAVHKPAYVGSNPKTKEKINVPAKNSLKIKFGSDITKALAQPAEKADKKTKETKAKDAKAEAKTEAKGKGKAKEAKAEVKAEAKGKGKGKTK